MSEETIKLYTIHGEATITPDDIKEVETDARGTHISIQVGPVLCHP